MKKTILMISFVLSFFILFFTHKAFAQTCGGSTTTQCNDLSQYNYNPIKVGVNQYGENCYGCDPYIYPYNGYLPCGLVDLGYCGACVKGPEYCSGINPHGQWFDGFSYSTCYRGVNIQPDAVLQSGSCVPTVELKCNYGCKEYCDAGTTNCGACGGYEPTNTCGNTGGSQTCQHNTCSSGACTCTNTNFSKSCTDYYSNCYNNYYCPAGAGYRTTCQTYIYVHVYIDYGHDGSNDANYPYGTVYLNGGNAQTTGADGTVSYGGLYSGNTYTISYSDSSADYQPTGATSQNVSLNSSNGKTTVYFRVTPLYSISGRVFIDTNHNQNYDGSDTGYNNGTIYVKQGSTTITTAAVAADGTYNTGEILTSGNYTVQYVAALPQGYTMTTTTSWGITLGDIGTPGPQCSVGTSPDAVCGNPNGGSISGLNFGVDKPYQISGNIFNDKNLDTQYNGSDTLFTSGSTISITGPINMSVNAANGVYTTGQVLLPGTYTVTYNTSATPLPAGYDFQTSNTFQVVLGYNPKCSPGGSPDATCGAPNNGSGVNTGSINNLNFGVTNEHSHHTAVCLDIRVDNNGGTVTNQLPPAGTTCGGMNASEAVINNGSCSTGSGIVFSCNGTFDFGLGSADANDWTVGGPSQDADCYLGGGLDVIPTSYEFLTTTARESNITPTNLDNLTNSNPSTSCTVTNCSLPADLPKGIYQVNGNLTLNAADYTFPAPPDPSTVSYAYIILVNGDLHINGNIYVPRGSVVVFSVSGNIYVDKSVGNVVSDPNNTSVNNPNLEGVYSSDKSFIVESYGSGTAICNLDGTPLDKRLVVLGVIVTNAAKAGGSFTNNRDLCIYDNYCSSAQVGDGGNPADQGTLYNYILDLMADGVFVNSKNFNWQELRP